MIGQTNRMTNAPKNGMPVKTYVLKIDVEIEIDAGSKWKTSNLETYEGVYRGIPLLQGLCEPYGVKPVFLISQAVLVDRKSVACLKSLGRKHCEFFYYSREFSLFSWRKKHG